MVVIADIGAPGAIVLVFVHLLLNMCIVMALAFLNLFMNEFIGLH